MRELQIPKGDKQYDFYRCDKCGRLITRVEELSCFNPKSRNYGQICSCGSRRFRPTNMQWYHWFFPRVWLFAWLRLRGVC